MPTARPEKNPTRTPAVVNWLQWTRAAAAWVEAVLLAVLDSELDCCADRVVVAEVVGLGLEVDVAENGAELVGAEEEDTMQLVPSHL